MKEIIFSVTRGPFVSAVLTDRILTELAVEDAAEQPIVGNIYKGIVKKYVSAVNGIFVDVGIGKNVFLRIRDIPGGKIPSEGSTLTVQIKKDETDMKGPLGTGKIEISGKYGVLLTDTNYIGISKRITDQERRNRLRKTAEKYCGLRTGIIIRTAAETIDDAAFERDLHRLIRQKEVIENRSRLAAGASLLFRADDLAVRYIRDFYTEDTERIVIDDKNVYERILTILHENDLFVDEKVFLYTEKLPLLHMFHIDEQIEELLSRKVSLPSGGTLVIDDTEALTAIDVNSGRLSKDGLPREEAAYQTNREAAKEIARQVRLRDIGGMIMIDFIDMDQERHRQSVVQYLRQAFRQDRVKTVICGFTALGLVEMTRERTTRTLWHHYKERCHCCCGMGRVDTISVILAKIETDLLARTQETGRFDPLLLICREDLAPCIPKEEWMKKFHREITVEVSRKCDSRPYTLLSGKS